MFRLPLLMRIFNRIGEQAELSRMVDRLIAEANLELITDSINDKERLEELISNLTDDELERLIELVSEDSDELDNQGNDS